MQSLQTVLKNRTILFNQYIVSYLDDIIWSYPEHEAVKGSMMKFTQGQPIADIRLSLRFVVGNNVGCVQ